VGGGQAAYQTASTLRAEGYDGGIRIFSDEWESPYHRPPLSKGFLDTGKDIPDLGFANKSFYSENQIDLHLGEPIVSIDRASTTIRSCNGNQYAYDRLVLATGARARSLLMDAVRCDNIFYLRSIRDAQGLRQALPVAERIVVIGGGFVGLEVAATARCAGKAVTVVESGSQLLSRALSPVAAEHLRCLHASKGVRILLDRQVVRLKYDSTRVIEIELANGERLSTDIVVVGIGALPNAELAVAAGLPGMHGIAVDKQLRTGDPAVLAIGDCALHDDRFSGTAMRLESVQNAVDNGIVAASTILGREVGYDSVPWFWSEQFDTKLQMVGIATRCDRSVIRGDAESGKFSIWHFAGNRLLAVDSFNHPADHMAGRRLLAGRFSILPTQAADVGFSLKAAMQMQS
jgi:3-phenylpropionate/trans-cinnamate dioxygenase ferredoxin reductase subunit